MNSAGCQENRKLIRSDLHSCLYNWRNNHTDWMGFSAWTSSLTNAPGKPPHPLPQGPGLNCPRYHFTGSFPRKVRHHTQILFLGGETNNFLKLKVAHWSAFSLFSRSHPGLQVLSWPKQITHHILQRLTKGQRSQSLEFSLPGLCLESSIYFGKDHL